MRSRRFRKPALNVALFPFLAVLVCTMGALIVLLVLVVQQARVQASDIVDSSARDDAATEQQLAVLKQKKTDLAWRREIMVAQRDEMRQQLADSRLQLGHLEDHIRRLQDKWTQLQTVAKEMEDLQANSAGERDRAESERDQLQQQLQAARDALEEARREVEQRPRSFAIIPYPGPHGTQRKPIYIECTAQGIVLQPEGVILRAEDFNGPLGPGNPLDAALRTTRAHLARLGTTATHGEPYPLLVVRPDGAIAYNVARLAMKAWDDEFGYELIDSEMQLAFPPADPHLKGLLEAAIRDARDRQSALAAAMPSQFQGGLTDGFVASPDSGFTPFREGSGTGSGGSEAGLGVGEFQGEAVTGLRRRSTSETVVAAGNDEQQTAEQAGSSEGATGGPNAEQGNGGGSSMSLASARGRDWGLRKPDSPNATAIVRPIRVICHRDRLVILPERARLDAPLVVQAPTGPRAVIDQFVAAIWKQVDRWGIAVPGGYWRPTLQIQVAPDAEFRFGELQRSLQGSGLDVQRER